MKIRKRILAAVLTAIMTISMLPANTFATETVGNEEAESAVEAVSVSTEELEVESSTEDISEEKTAEAVVEYSETAQTVETADPAAEEEAVAETETEEAEAEEPAAAEPAAEPAVEEVEATDTVDWPVTLEAKDKDYVVAVTYDAEAGIPADAKVEVEEILANDKAYDEYVEQAADKIDADVENLSYVRLFDISLVGADGGKLEPTGPVDVKIRLKDVEKADETTQVVHFAGEKEIPEIIDTEIKGKDVSFETDGFSIYAVVAEGDGSEARLKVTFDLNGGSINGSEENIVILVKPDDITDNDGNEFNKIVYDPGMPEAANKKFMGWTTEQNYTNETTPMTIDQIREDIKTKLASVKEGDTVTYYAMMFNAFELYYVNENNVLFNTVSLLSTADSVTTEVKQEYSVTGSTKGFVGWVKQGTEQPVYTVGQQITITTAQPQVVLTPKLGPGKWLYFDGNDGGSTAADTASYTPPAFIPQDTPATDYEPANPTRLGYTFDGWYTEAEGGAKFNFSQTLTEDKTVYAHWIPNPEAQYTVIVWAQSVDDNWDAADADKTYDYVESPKFTVATGTQITEDLLRQGGFLSKTDSDFGVTDLEHGSKAFQYRTFEVKNGVGSGKDEVSAMGDTVVNVYYDRKIMTIEFANAPGGTSQTYYEPVDSITGTEAYGLVDGEYVLLTTTVEKYIAWTSSASSSTGNIGELSTIYYKNGSVSTSYSVSSFDLTKAAIGTKYSSFDPSTGVLASSGNNMYRDSDTHTRIYAIVQGRNPSYSYNGQPYTGQVYAKKTGNVLVYTGLYGQPLSKYGYEWPESTNGWNNIAYIGSFNGSLFGHSGLGGKANKISTSPDSSTQNTTIIFYVQDPENESNYTQVATARYDVGSNSGFMITERFLGTEPSGYRWTTSSTRPTTWTSGTAVDSEGYTTEHRGSNTYLHIKYDRVKNNIVFRLGTQTVHTIEGIPYGKNLSEYEDDAPEAPQVGENEYFYGWFEDPEGVTKVNWNGNMPLANKVIYGITGPVQYHVIIEMNAGGDTVDFGGASQKTEFWLDYGETISGANLMRATRTNSDGDSYSIIGYYTENAEAGQFDNNKLWNFDAGRVTEQSLAVKYTGPDDPRRVEYGDNGYPNTVGVFKLYASWRDDSLINSGGIHIRYDDGTETFVDPYGYADMATVIVKSELNEENCPDDKYFAGWKLGEVVYLPGQTFSAAKDAAVKESDGYYITLTAEYADVEEKTPTHIVWYRNDGSEGDAAIHHKSEELDINQATNVPAAPTRAGFKFLGWAKDTEKESAEAEPKTTTAKTTADFLEYKEDGKFYLSGTTTVVTAVAADEVLPYEALYAIWEPQYSIYHSATGKTEVIGPADLTGGKLNLTGKVTGGYLYGGYYHYTEDGDHKGAAYTEESGLSMTPVVGTTYYLKEVDAAYLKPAVYLVYSKIHGGLIRSLYGFVDIDTQNDYTDAGLDIGGTEIHIFGEGKLTDGTITVSKESGNETLTPSKLFGVDTAAFGYADLSSYISGGARVLINGYYKTQDGVKVTGYKTRVIQFAANDETYGAPVFKGWNSNGNTVCGLASVTPTYTPVSKNLTAGRFTLMRSLMISAPADTLEYTITKVYDSGTELQTVEEGNRVGEITYTERSGSYFAGWYMDSAFETPADFSAVNSDMTVYARFVKASDVSVSFARKSAKSGTTTFNTTVAVKGDHDLTDVTVTAGGNASVLAGRSLAKSGSGKNAKYTTQYKGTSAVKGLSLIGSFTASAAWTTADGTVVHGPSYKCTYILGLVTVR